MTIITTIAVFAIGFGVGYLHAWLNTEYTNAVTDIEEEDGTPNIY